MAVRRCVTRISKNSQRPSLHRSGGQAASRAGSEACKNFAKNQHDQFVQDHVNDAILTCHFFGGSPSPDPPSTTSPPSILNYQFSILNYQFPHSIGTQGQS